MSSRIKIRAQQADGITEVKALMRHPMETGDIVRVTWSDNQGGTGEGETTIR
jgi:hypothetical protein